MQLQSETQVASLLDRISELERALDSARTELAETRQAREKLGRSAEELSARLNQAAKMEAIGCLAGGVAHDFNNLLTVINVYGEMLVQGLPEGDPLRAKAVQIQNAGETAAGLTRQLLAFSRKQVLKRHPILVNDSVERTTRMLSRVIGENIEVTTRLGAGLPRVLADAGQLEQVLMNLAVNARDAMPRGGRLLIETAVVDLDARSARLHLECKPGPHVMIAVTDTGTGMDAHTQSRIFEPFFTTKGLGRGTGLGLSTVYGIVKQSGGSIWVYSELGKGTTFKVYFPVCAESAKGPGEGKPSMTAAPGDRTILLVEDDSMVRGALREILLGAGYRVLVAEGMEGAVCRCTEHTGPIHLLLTDMVMPGHGGVEVAKAVQSARPGTAVAYMSGFTDQAILDQELRQGVVLLEKPISASKLLKKLAGMVA